MIKEFAQLNSFINKDHKHKSVDLFVDNVVYLFVSEFGWSQKDFEDAEIPFILQVLNTHRRVLSEQEKKLRKRK